MEEYKSDVKIVVIVIVTVALIILYNKDYLFSQNTIDQIKVVKNLEPIDINHTTKTIK
ncbi:MAG: hypothetical protein U9Q20_07395 [Campylobacterota bacterium]|nr:hypothetical protein [Campylobacterota bacterium]